MTAIEAARAAGARAGTEAGPITDERALAKLARLLNATNAGPDDRRSSSTEDRPLDVPRS